MCQTALGASGNSPSQLRCAAPGIPPGHSALLRSAVISHQRGAALFHFRFYVGLGPQIISTSVENASCAVPAREAWSLACLLSAQCQRENLILGEKFKAWADRIKWCDVKSHRVLPFSHKIRFVQSVSVSIPIQWQCLCSRTKWDWVLVGSKYSPSSFLWLLEQMS